MPTPTTTTAQRGHGPSSDLLSRLASPDPDTQLKALREVKNQIIGNRTKKLFFLKLGAVPALSSIVAQVQAQDQAHDAFSNILVQSAAALGSFACGFDAGVRAILDSGSFPLLLRLLSHSDEKVVDAGSRALRMIYQSKLAPKFDFLQDKNMSFLVSLLDSESENVTGLAASVITHSCKAPDEQGALYDAGVVTRLVRLLKGSLSQRDASLEALAAIFKDNAGVIEKFADNERGQGLNSVIELTKDRCLRTRLLAGMCLVVVRNASECFLQDIGIKRKLVYLLLELLDDPGQVGDDASFVFSRLVGGKEDMQKLAFDSNAVDRFCSHLQKGQLHLRRMEGVLLALADLCSRLECCRYRFLSLQGLNLVTDALKHESADVRAAACTCLRSITRSIKNLCAGVFMNETLVVPLIRLLEDPLASVQVAALGVISNIVVDFMARKSAFVQCGGVNQLIESSKSMESAVRFNALWALKNMMFLADDKFKEDIFSKLTASLLASLISDPEPSVQEQALALVRNLVDGCISSIEYVFAEDGMILDAVGRQLQAASKVEIEIQGMYVLGNVASGNLFHKEAVMHLLLPADNGSQPFLIKFLQSIDNRLRTAAVWAVINLTFPSCPGASERLGKLQSAGIISQIRNMDHDPCLDVKLRVETVITQSLPFGDGLT